jgi:hypothetical protein
MGSINKRYKNTIINRDQGGGPKKAGFPFQVGVSAASSIARTAHPLLLWQIGTKPWMPNSRASRPIGWSTAIHFR